MTKVEVSTVSKFLTVFDLLELLLDFCSIWSKPKKYSTMINVDKLSTKLRFVTAHASCHPHKDHFKGIALSSEILETIKCRRTSKSKKKFKKYLMLPFEERKQEECLLAAPRNSSGVQEVLVVIGGICNNKKLKEVDYYNSVKGQIF